jgi:hypothetical protein
MEWLGSNQKQMLDIADAGIRTLVFSDVLLSGLPEGDSGFAFRLLGLDWVNAPLK